LPILHTHTRALLLIERARVHLDEGRVVYADAADHGDGISRSWNIPSLNCCAIVLGQGTSLTQAAARKLADDGVMVAFAGTGGTPLFCASQDYRPTERLQRWISRWPQAQWRLDASKQMQLIRRAAIRDSWLAFAKDGFSADPSAVLARFESSSGSAASIDVLMGAEGACTRELYRLASSATGCSWKERQQGAGDGADRANHFLDHGNYLAYGLASVALWALGVPTGLPVTHGVHRGGGLVFDLADVIKDGIVLPTAFQCAAERDCKPQDFRERLIERLHGATWLDPNGSIGLLFRVIDTLVAAPQGTPL
jgi:CRISPR-associated protein Cas1